MEIRVDFVWRGTSVRRLARHQLAKNFLLVDMEDGPVVVYATEWFSEFACRGEVL